MEELADAGRSVYLCRLIVVARDLLQTRDEQNHVVTDDRPYADNADGDPRDVGIGDPRDIGMEDVVQETELLVVQPLPNHGDRRRGTDHGQEEDGTEQGGTLELLVQEHCEDQSDDNAERHFDDRVLDGVPERMPNFAGGKDLGIVFKTYKNIALAEVARLAEGLPQCVERRIKVQDKSEKNL